MNRAVALICGICHPVFSVPNPHAEFVSTFTDKKLSPHGSAWPFAGRLSSCVKVFAFASFAFHNDLHPFIICHRHQCFVRSLYLCEFNFAVIFDFLLRQIIRCIFLMVCDDTAIKGIFENMRNDSAIPPVESRRGLSTSAFQLVLDLHISHSIQPSVSSKSSFSFKAPQIGHSTSVAFKTTHLQSV